METSRNDSPASLPLPTTGRRCARLRSCTIRIVTAAKTSVPRSPTMLNARHRIVEAVAAQTRKLLLPLLTVVVIGQNTGGSHQAFATPTVNKSAARVPSRQSEAHSQVPPAIIVARRIPGQGQSVHATSVIVGEGWGCAQFASEAGWTWQCWDAPNAPETAEVRAWKVPWMKNKRLQAGPNRMCESISQSLTFRCWHQPRRGETEGRELPSKWEWLNPNHAQWEETYSRSDRIGATLVGGTFGCVKSTRFEGLWCMGDYRYNATS